MDKKILIIAANPAVSTTTGWPVGFWASEVAHPYRVFKEAGYEIVVASPAGGKLEMDALSNPLHTSGYSAGDEISKLLLQEPAFKKSLENTPALSEINPDDFAAIVVAGGQAPMFNFVGQQELHRFFTTFYQSGKPTAALCHGTAVLRYAKTAEGKFLVEGKQVTGFTNGEEDDADSAAGTKVMPWRIEEELQKLGANFQKAEKWQPFVVSDGNLITGQQNMSGEAVAKEVLHQLNKNQSHETISQSSMER